MRTPSTVVIGAGAAGLAAAYELSTAGEAVRVLEARQRLGGRIHTISGGQGEPVELGAEFIHGKAPELLNLLSRAGLPTTAVADYHRVCCGSVVADWGQFWEGLSDLIKAVDLKQDDQSFAGFLRRQPGLAFEWKQFATDYIEGFDAADAEQISLHSVVTEQKASERIHGDEMFRVTTGYGSLIQWLETRLRLKNVPLHCGAVVASVEWAPGAVTIKCKNGETFETARVIITLPLAMLKAGDVRFEPAVSEKLRFAEALEMGHVIKLNLQFRSRFWPEEDFGFVHACDEWIPTWWSHKSGNLLTGWIGGPRAQQLANVEQEELVRHATAALARIFRVGEHRVTSELQSVFWHNWTADPFSGGAYSYIRTGGLNAQQELASPVEDTLFFAGEATAQNAQLGTVHGAIGSGQRAARQVLDGISAQTISG